MTLAASTGVERRRALRFPMPPDGGVVSVVGARLLNVSAGGMLIESLTPLESESIHRFRLIVAGEKMDIEAKVASCVARPGEKRRSYGIGMEFKRMPPGAKEQLGQVLSGLPPAKDH
jgi:c-di-GMP-binding flagellar brake protein YcgR